MEDITALYSNNHLNTQQQECLLAICNASHTLWTIDGRLPYGTTNTFEFIIEMNDPNMRPIKQKPRPLNSLQSQSLQTQILDWKRAKKCTEHPIAPSDC